MSTLAPLSSRSRATSTCPLRAATMRPVTPSCASRAVGKLLVNDSRAHLQKRNVALAGGVKGKMAAIRCMRKGPGWMLINGVGMITSSARLASARLSRSSCTISR